MPSAKYTSIITETGRGFDEENYRLGRGKKFHINSLKISGKKIQNPQSAKWKTAGKWQKHSLTWEKWSIIMQLVKMYLR